MIDVTTVLRSVTRPNTDIGAFVTCHAPCRTVGTARSFTAETRPNGKPWLALQAGTAAASTTSQRPFRMHTYPFATKRRVVGEAEPDAV